MTNFTHPPRFEGPDGGAGGGSGYGEDSADFAQSVQFGTVEVGLWPNERYPQGQTQEVTRIVVEAGQGRQYEFSMMLGSLTEADADAIAIPSNPWFGLGGGGVENALARDMDEIAGDEPYSEQGAGSQFFKQTERYVAEEQPFGYGSPTSPYKKQVPFGHAHAFDNEQMATRGIKSVILVNTLPHAEQNVTLNAETVSMAVRNALIAAEETGATSLAISEIGTGFLAAIGGSPYKTREEAWAPMLSGLLQYAELAAKGQVRGSVDKLSLAVYARPSDENARQVGRMLETVVESAKVALKNSGRPS